MNIIFLGGMFPDSDKQNIISSSKGVVQYAADNLQKSFIQGLSKSSEVETLTVINLPFIGSYPQRYSKVFFSPLQKLYKDGCLEIRSFGFCNLWLVKNIFRLFNSFMGAFRKVNEIKSGAVIICYSMHLPFLVSCYLIKLIRKDVKLCIVVPDLPEYMSERSGIKKIIFSLIGWFSYGFVNRADFIVALTDDMFERFRKGLPGVVIEGMASEDLFLISEKRNIGSYFLYTGTLDRRYGLKRLVDSFLEANLVGCDLYICGDGDDRIYVESLALNNKCLRYFGQVDREVVLSLQRNAALLINPRSNEEEYTKYSFPSKTIEYMASGVPVLMYPLKGVPKDYFDFCYLIPSGSSGLKDKLIELSRLPIEELENKGQAAKNFIFEKKMPASQIQKLLDEMKKVLYV